jgi:membrane-bound serine protease (ClpP class)
VVDLVAADLPALLQAVDGRTVRLPAGDVRLATRDARLQQEELTPAERLLAAIADPNIAFLLMSLAMLAIFIELSHPGSILPGIVGGICLLLALFALGTLPVNLTGLLLIGLGFVLLLAEVWVTSSGLLAIGGLTALGLGAMLLVSESAPPSFEVNRWLIAGTLAVMAVPFLLLARSLASLRRREHRTGLEALVGLRGVARTALAPVGTVLVHGELWQATAEDESLEPETAVVVTGVEGFALRVKRAESLKMGV